MILNNFLLKIIFLMCPPIPFIKYFFQINVNFLIICPDIKEISFHSEPYLYVV